MISGMQRNAIGKWFRICARAFAVVVSLASSFFLIESVTVLIAGGIVPPAVLLFALGCAAMVWFPLWIAFAGLRKWQTALYSVLTVDAVYVVLGIAFMWPGVTWPDDPSPFSCGSIRCASTLLRIDAAKEQASLEFKWTNGTPIEMGGPDMVKVNAYLRDLSGTTNTPVCHAGGRYRYNAIGVLPECSLGDTESSDSVRLLNSRRVRRRVTLLTYRHDPPFHDGGSNHDLRNGQR